jgi:hypothetical protein
VPEQHWFQGGIEGVLSSARRCGQINAKARVFCFFFNQKETNYYLCFFPVPDCKLMAMAVDLMRATYSIEIYMKISVQSMAAESIKLTDKLSLCWRFLFGGDN